MDTDWSAFEDGASLGQTGTDGGSILRDEEHSLGARITLEGAPMFALFSITCGVYGWMCHTRFLQTRQHADRDFDLIKIELARIVDLVPARDDPAVDEKTTVLSDAISNFVDRFP